MTKGAERTPREDRRRSSVRDVVREETRAAYREAILVAAERVFGRLGFHEAKMTDIAAEAGVAAGTLYNYFKNKDEVFASILERGHDQVTQLFDAHSDVADPILRTRLRLRQALAYIEEHGQLFAMFLRINGITEYVQKRALDDHGERSYTDGLARTEAVVREAQATGQLRSDVPVADLAVMMMGICDATIFAWTRAGCPPGLAARADLIVDLFLQGAQAP